MLPTLAKPFRMFGYVIEDLNHEEDGDAVDEDLIHPVSITEALIDQRRNVHRQLPPHQRCACHSLNLIATKDAEDAESNSQFKKLYRSATAKAQAIWNKSSRSVQVAEAVLEICKQALVKPNQTRWNSWYMAIQRLVKINKDEPRALAILCERIDLPRIDLIYCQPLAKALVAGIDKRFGAMMTDPKLLAASLIHPHFKSDWLIPNDLIAVGMLFNN